MRRTFLLCIAAASCATPPGEAVPGARSSTALGNVHRVAPGVLSGAAPYGDEAFRELARIGVRTVISVDGARPDVEVARRHGLRYVHLPIGYDGIPAPRAMELGKALEELQGPFYFHCHHGRHRGPAAAVVACVVAGKLDNDGAVRIMKKAGTDERYLGLWSSARTAKAADPAVLRSLTVEYRETAPVPPLREAMVALDETLERLELSRKAGWRKPSDHPDVDPPHEALRAREIFTEIMRTDDYRGRPDEFKDRMRGARESAGEVERALRKTKGGTIERTFVEFRRSCTDCHVRYRNTPREE